MDTKRHRLRIDGIEVEVEQVLHRGWEGIVYRDPASNRLYLNSLEWHNGAYIEKVRPLSLAEYESFRDGGV